MGHGIHPGSFLFIHFGLLCNIQHCKHILLGALLWSLIKFSTFLVSRFEDTNACTDFSCCYYLESQGVAEGGGRKG